MACRRSRRRDSRELCYEETSQTGSSGVHEASAGAPPESGNYRDRRVGILSRYDARLSGQVAKFRRLT